MNSVSVLIKDMVMPETCDDCHFHVYYSHYEYVCKATPLLYPMNLANTKGIRKDWCPLVELPEKHGRLVDADVLHVLFEDQWHYLQCLNWDENPTAEAKQTGINWCINTLHDDAPTIIEAEGDEE